MGGEGTGVGGWGRLEEVVFLCLGLVRKTCCVPEEGKDVRNSNTVMKLLPVTGRVTEVMIKLVVMAMMWW